LQLRHLGGEVRAFRGNNAKTVALDAYDFGFHFPSPWQVFLTELNLTCRAKLATNISAVKQ